MSRRGDFLTDFIGYYPDKERSKADKSAMQVTHESTVLWSMGFWHLWRRKGRYCLYFLAALVLSGLSGLKAWHLKLLYLAIPELFTAKVIKWLYQFYWWQHGLAVFVIVFGVWACILFGFVLRWRRTFYGKKFEEAGLVTNKGRTPAPVHVQSLGHGRKLVEVDGQGVPKNRFDEKKDDLEAIFDQKIESISEGKKPSRVQIIFTHQRIPHDISYQDLQERKKLKPYSFYVGMSAGGVVSQCISDLPHLLITGSTGNGKSVFFKQALLGLLQSSPHLKMYLLDLKHGLEMRDFSKAPNVTIAKTMNEALEALKKIKAEMDRRFDYLQKNGFKEIVPTRDKMDRIIVAVDEASVLYMNRNRYDPEYKQVQEARSLADSIAKLSRAAGINLMLATQKLTSEVLPTSVTENVAGRMCFRAESLHGSLLVLGNKDATTLPDIRGRGIWSLGGRQTVVQAPFISEDEIRKYSGHMAIEFQNGLRKCFGSISNDDEVHESTTDTKLINEMATSS